MTEPTEIWICAAHHPAFRCGGWAFVRRIKGQLSGVAGGGEQWGVGVIGGDPLV